MRKRPCTDDQPQYKRDDCGGGSQTQRQPQPNTNQRLISAWGGQRQLKKCAFFSSSGSV